MKVKVGQIWNRDKDNYFVLHAEPHRIVAMTDPSIEPEENGLMWESGEEHFLKEFKLVRDVDPKSD